MRTDTAGACKQHFRLPLKKRGVVALLPIPFSLFPFMKKTKTIIGVMGPGEKAKEIDLQNAYLIGKLIAQQNWILLTGGRNIGVYGCSILRCEISSRFNHWNSSRSQFTKCFQVC